MKRKKVTLNRKVYRKGDLIKGRIVFEYPEEINSLCPVIDFIASSRSTASSKGF